MTGTTNFADMPTGQRNRWLAWANDHDWGGGRPAHWDGSTLVAYGYEFSLGGGGLVIEGRFTNPSDLRAWAGY